MQMTTKTAVYGIMGSLALSFLTLACGSDDDASANVQVTLQAEASLQDGFVGELLEANDAALILHVVRVEAHSAGDADNNEGGWQVLSERNRDIDLFEYLSEPVELAAGALPAGKLTQIRLVLDSGRQATFKSGDEEYEVRVPSGSQSGLKIIFAPPRVVAEDEPTTIHLELGGSLRNQGSGFRLQPVLKAARD